MAHVQRVEYEILQLVASLPFDHLCSLLRAKGVPLNTSAQFRDTYMSRSDVDDSDPVTSKNWQLTNAMLDELWSDLPKYIDCLRETGNLQIAKLLEAVGECTKIKPFSIFRTFSTVKQAIFSVILLI